MKHLLIFALICSVLFLNSPLVKGQDKDGDLHSRLKYEMSFQYGWRSAEVLDSLIVKTGDAIALGELMYAYPDSLDLQLKCAVSLIEDWDDSDAYYEAYWIRDKQYKATGNQQYRKEAVHYLFEGALHKSPKCFHELSIMYEDDKHLQSMFHYLSIKYSR